MTLTVADLHAAQRGAAAARHHGKLAQHLLHHKLACAWWVGVEVEASKHG